MVTKKTKFKKVEIYSSLEAKKVNHIAYQIEEILENYGKNYNSLDCTSCKNVFDQLTKFNDDKFILSKKNGYTINEQKKSD